MDEIEQLLAFLHEVPNQGESTIKDIRDRLARLGREEQILSASGILNRRNGFLAFLKARRDDAAPNVKALAFDVIAEVIKDYPQVVDEFCHEIQNLSWGYFNSNERANVKKTVVSCVRALVSERRLNEDNARKTMKKRIKAVKSSLLELFGAIARQYSTCLESEDQKSLKRRYLNTLETMFKGKMDLELMAGAINGLNDFMCSFDLSSNELDEVFKYVAMTVSTLEDITRYSLHKAGLKMIWNHAGKFRSQLLSNKEMLYKIHSDLRKCCDHNNNELSHLGFRAMDSLINEVASFLSSRGERDNDSEIFWYFVRNFIRSLNAQNMAFKDISQAIRALGFFAPPCRIYMSPTEVNDLRQLLCRKLESVLLELTDDRVSHLNAFISAFASIAKESNSIDQSLELLLGQLSSAILLVMPKMRFSYRPVVIKAFVELLEVIFQKSAVVFTRYWDKTGKLLANNEITKFIIVLPIAYQALVLGCAENLNASTKMDDVDGAAYLEYMTFWDIVMDKSSYFKSDLTARREIYRLIYDGFMECLLRVPANLNLVVTELVNEEGSGKKEEVVQQLPSSGDMACLKAQNLKDFQILINFVDFCDTVLPKLSTQEFGSWVLPFGRSLVTFSTKHPLVSGFYKMFSICLKATVTIGYFGDIFKEQFGGDGYSTALKLGLGFPPLALMALDTLELWASKFPSNLLHDAYKEILPSLSDYLSVDGNFNDADPSTTSITTVQKRAGSGNAWKLSAVKEASHKSPLAKFASLQQIRYRILHFLGSVGEYNKFILGNQDHEGMVAWDTKNHLKVKIPFNEAIFEVYLDPLLPRIIALAENSPDRKTKVAANELLHALVVTMVGGSQLTLDDREKRTPYHRIYAKIFPVLLRLAIDVDKVTRELFRTLVFQLLHWLTGNSKYENPETMTMLEACFEAVSSSNGQLRDFGAECIAEYLKWSIKHVNDKALAENPINVKSLFKRIYLFCQHSSPPKRLGAAMIFNRIYTLYREYESLLDVFTFELLYYFLLSLKISDADNAALGTTIYIKKTLDHIAKMIIKSGIFKRSSPSRRSFPGLERADLNSLIEWIFSQIGKREEEYAHKCIELFDTFVSQTSVLENWTEKEWPRPRLTDSPSFFKYQVWMKDLTSCITGYLYLVDRKAIKMRIVFANQTGYTLMKAILLYVDNFSVLGEEPSFLTPKELSEMNHSRVKFVKKLFDLVDSALKTATGTGDFKGLEKIYASPRFHELVAACVFRPLSVGFELADDASLQPFQLTLVSLLRVMTSFLPEDNKSQLLDALISTGLNNDLDMRSADLALAAKTAEYMLAAKGLKTLIDANLLTLVLRRAGITSTEFFSSLHAKCKELYYKDDATSRQLCALLIEISLSDRSSRVQHLRDYLGLSPLSTGAGSVKPVPPFFRFSFTVIQCLSEDFSVLFNLVEEEIHQPVVFDALYTLMDWIISHKETQRAKISSFCSLLEVNRSIMLSIKSEPMKFANFVRKFAQVVLDLKGSQLNDIAPKQLGEQLTETFFKYLSDSSSSQVLHEFFDLLPLFVCDKTAIK
ncbi:hypothetical protein HDU76_004302, partial [Blyttiomyces sp. JEL0837]